MFDYIYIPIMQSSHYIAGNLMLNSTS